MRSVVFPRFTACFHTGRRVTQGGNFRQAGGGRVLTASGGQIVFRVLPLFHNASLALRESGAFLLYERLARSSTIPMAGNVSAYVNGEFISFSHIIIPVMFRANIFCQDADRMAFP
jgi:hypothetical protein